MTDVLDQRGRQSQTVCKKVPTRAAKQVIHHAKRQQHRNLAEAELHQLMFGFFPAGGSGKTRQSGDNK